jgi:putative toxin-antitoxin system antitoxin component (TIGR02293 family)
MPAPAALPEDVALSRPAAREIQFREEIDWDAIDALVLLTLEDKTLHRKLRNLDRLELADIWIVTRKALLKHKSTHEVIPPLELHKRLVEGLSGESLLVSSSMFLDTLQEAERFFDISFKTIKSRLGRTLDTSASELAMRAARVSTAAAEVLGGFEAARRYMRTKNFALGGATPLDLLKTAEGERLVMNELQAQAESGPL